MWESLAPLHVDRLVNPLAATFTATLQSTDRAFTIAQDLEGRRRGLPAIDGTDQDNGKDAAEMVPSSDDCLTERESKTGAVIWDGAAVASGILDKASYVRNKGADDPPPNSMENVRLSQLDPLGKAVIELGCGCAALPGMTAAALGAERVLLTDLDVIIKSGVLRENLTGNLTTKELAILRKCALKWGCDLLLPEHNKGFDLILACDTVYDVALVIPLLESIEFIMKSSQRYRDCVALITYDESIGRRKAYRTFEVEAKNRFGVVERLREKDFRVDLASDSVTAFIIMQPKIKKV